MDAHEHYARLADDPVAMFYGGLVRTKNVIGTMMHSFAAMAIIGVLWPIVGYFLLERAWVVYRME